MEMVGSTILREKKEENREKKNTINPHTHQYFVILFSLRYVCMCVECERMCLYVYVKSLTSAFILYTYICKYVSICMGCVWVGMSVVNWKFY